LQVHQLLHLLVVAEVVNRNIHLVAHKVVMVVQVEDQVVMHLHHLLEALEIHLPLAHHKEIMVAQVEAKDPLTQAVVVVELVLQVLLDQIVVHKVVMVE
tara:strand:- start:393 stop:689 length:297 start_codon:yes stop_codon:yes gene_type:complete